MGVLRVELSEGISFEVNEQGYMSLKQDEDKTFLESIDTIEKTMILLKFVKFCLTNEGIEEWKTKKRKKN
jgi:hypothetical protein